MPDDNSVPFTLRNPVTAGFFITDPFNSPRAYANGRHEGIDLRAVRGGQACEVVAAQRGVVDRLRTGDTGYGNYVRLRHDWADGSTWFTWYAHLATINASLALGDVVEAGQRLGAAGTTGNSSGIHLHLTLQHLYHGLKGYVVADVVDPSRYITDVTVPTIDELTYLADVTVPDGAALAAGQPFTKTWRVQNSGTSTWHNFTLEHYGDERMNGPECVILPALRPGEQGEMSVELTAPATPGRHRSAWKARNVLGRLFAFELYAEIVVSPVARRDDAVLVADVTLPDGEQVESDRSVLKTWRVRNTGDAAWDKGHTLAVAGDNPFQAEAETALPAVKPGATADLSCALTLPSKPGLYRSIWRLRSPDGAPFGPELVVQLRVVPAAKPQHGLACVADVTVFDGTRMRPGYEFTKTWRVRNTGASDWAEGYELAAAGDNSLGGPAGVPLPALQSGREANVSIDLVAPSTVGPCRAAWQARTTGRQTFGDILDMAIEVVRPGEIDQATYLADVTYPDGAVVNAGEKISKTWRLRNTGSSAWAAGYALVFVADNRMNGPDSAPLPSALPGEEVEVTVPLEAPLAPGIHRSTWRPRNPEGQLFGDTLYAELRVPVSSTTAREDAQLEEHVTYPDGSEVVAGRSFEKTWAIRNTGSVPWAAGYELALVGGPDLGGEKRIPVAGVQPQEVVRVSVRLTAPEEPGRYITRWRMRNARGELFGTTLFAYIVAVRALTKIDLLPYLRGDGRLYELKYIFDMPNGPSIGQQRLQTQIDGTRFYQTKNSEWEELWADDRFIYRGADTSPGSGNFYVLMDGERYGAAWIPRLMAVGQAYRRSVVVVSRRKGNCVMNSHLSGRHVTWVRFEAFHENFTLPDVEGRPGRGLKLQDVAVLAAYNEVNGRPAARPFERYYYAKGFGLVMWEGIETDHKGQSFLVEIHLPGARPDNVRERIACLENLRP
jgi:hypothetical protein